MAALKGQNMGKVACLATAYWHDYNNKYIALLQHNGSQRLLSLRMTS